MSNMLTQDDLKAIGQVFDERFDVKFDEKLNDPQGVLSIKFDAVQEQIDDVKKNIESVESRMLTIEKLERYELGLTERYDRRYVRK